MSLPSVKLDDNLAGAMVVDSIEALVPMIHIFV